MLQLLKEIVDRIQWPKVRKEIQRLFPGTLALAKRMEYELMVAVKQSGNRAIGVDIHYVDARNGKPAASLYELKVLMEQCSRKSLGMPCSKKFMENFSEIPLADLINGVEEACDKILLERQTDACIPRPFTTESPSIFITGNTIEDPWFLSVPGRGIPKMVDS